MTLLNVVGRRPLSRTCPRCGSPTESRGLQCDRCAGAPAAAKPDTRARFMGALGGLATKDVGDALRATAQTWGSEPAGAPFPVEFLVGFLEERLRQRVVEAEELVLRLRAAESGEFRGMRATLTRDRAEERLARRLEIVAPWSDAESRADEHHDIEKVEGDPDRYDEEPL